jgi:hypothetical protein
MRGHPDAWKPDEVAELQRLRARGLTREEISIKIGRTPQAIKTKISRLKVGDSNQPWTKEQVEFLKDNAGLSAADMVADLNQLGPERTASSVKAKLTEMRRTKRRASPKGGFSNEGWPTLRGTDEERDAKFVRAVLLQKIRLGLIIVTREAA